MNKEIKSILKKTAKIAGVTCVATGAIAVMTSGVALKAISEGGKYLVDAVKKIVNEQAQVIDAVVSEEDFAAPEEVAAEDFAAPEEVPSEEEV